LVYNTKLVPPDKAPKGWEACLDPYFKGKFSVDTKPNVLAWLTPSWGEEKLLGFARRIKENSPLPVSFHEHEAIYTGAKNIHSALLWIEFLASREGQDVAESLEPGRSSFLVEGTLTNKLMKGANMSLCGNDCRGTEDKLMQRIATEAWGFPKVGYEPKK